MKRRLFHLLWALSIAASLTAQEAKQVFVNMPDSILPLLTKINREDCIDFLESNMKAVVKNRFDQQSEMTRLTGDYISMDITPQSTFQLKLLPINDSTRIICTVQTVCSRACDSHLAFYTTDWKRLPSAPYLPTMPQASDFLPDTLQTAIADTLSVSWQNLHDEADILLMQASLADSTSTLTFTYTTPDYMHSASAARIRPLLKAAFIRYDWINGTFIRHTDDEQ